MDKIGVFRFWKEEGLNNFGLKGLLFLVLTLFIGLTTLGRLARWDFLEQLAMADRSYIFGDFYPLASDSVLSGTSVYFPGLAYISAFLLNLFSANVMLYLMYFLAGTSVVLFYWIQKQITKEINTKANTDQFIYYVCLFYLFFCSQWLEYASEFKPDTITFLLGSVGVLLALKGKDNESMYYVFLGGLITGLALIFKQQHVAFIAGMVLYSFVKTDRFFRVFTLVSLFWSVMVLIFLYYEQACFYWTVNVLSDDGFLDLSSYGKEHFFTGIKFGVGAVVLVVLTRFRLITWAKWNYLKEMLFSTPWPSILILFSLSAFASAFKNGGNGGNTELGVVILLPLIFHTLKKIDFRVLFFFLILIIGMQYPKVKRNLMRFSQSRELNDAARNIKMNKDIQILSGSNVYGASRLITTTQMIDNYWMHGLNNNRAVREELEKILIQDKRMYDVLVVENWHENKEVIAKLSDYSVIFENEIGVIAISNRQTFLMK